MALPCTLQRTPSSPIWAETIDVGLGGMSVRATRPLQPDEIVEFDLNADVAGRARVLRQAGPRVYGLLFEELRPPMDERLARLLDRSPV
jgi:hypothetical protein